MSFKLQSESAGSTGNRIDNRGDFCKIIKAKARPAGKLDQIRPYTISVRQPIPNASAQSRNQMQGNIAASDCVFFCSERIHYLHCHVPTALPGQYSYDLR